MSDHHVLARRLVERPEFRWMPGMRTITGQRVVQVDTDGYSRAAAKGYFGDWQVADVALDALPDLRDPATLGCVLALVRQAYAPALIGVVPWCDGERVAWRVDADTFGDADAIATLNDTLSHAWDLPAEADALLEALLSLRVADDGQEDGA